MFPVLWGGVVARATSVFFQDVDVLAGEPSGDPGEGWQLLPEELDASFLEVGWDVCCAQCRVVERDLQFLLEILDVCPAVCVAEHAGEMLDGIGVMACSVVGGIGGVLCYPVRGLMGLRFGGYVLEVCVVPAEVGDLEGWQVRCALVYCLVVDLTISVLVPVGFLFYDVELDVGGKAAKGFTE